MPLGLGRTAPVSAKDDATSVCASDDQQCSDDHVFFEETGYREAPNASSADLAAETQTADLATTTSSLSSTASQVPALELEASSSRSAASDEETDDRTAASFVATLVNTPFETPFETSGTSSNSTSTLPAQAADRDELLYKPELLASRGAWKKGFKRIRDFLRSTTRPLRRRHSKHAFGDAKARLMALSRLPVDLDDQTHSDLLQQIHRIYTGTSSVFVVSSVPRRPFAGAEAIDTPTDGTLWKDVGVNAAKAVAEFTSSNALTLWMALHFFEYNKERALELFRWSLERREGTHFFASMCKAATESVADAVKKKKLDDWARTLVPFEDRTAGRSGVALFTAPQRLFTGILYKWQHVLVEKPQEVKVLEAWVLRANGLHKNVAQFIRIAQVPELLSIQAGQTEKRRLLKTFSKVMRGKRRQTVA